MQNFSDKKVIDAKKQTADKELTEFFTMTYGLMAIALLITGITAYLMSSVFLNQYIGLMNSMGQLGFFALLGLQLLAIFLIARNTVRNPALAFGMLSMLAVIEGIVMGGIFLIFTTESIAAVFAVTAAQFIAMSAWGLITKKDMSKFGPILFGAVIGLIAAAIVNLFLHSSMLAFIASIIGVIVFSIYTAYDNNRLKAQFYMFREAGLEDMTGLAVNGALALYLDFINLFMYLIQIFGQRDD